MRVLIPGGTGLIGRALSAELAKDGHEVILLSRAPQRAHNLPPGVRTERWDGRTAAGWGHLADGADAIVNLAGASIAGEGFFPARWTEARKTLLTESRLHTARAVVEAVQGAAQKPGAVIQASAIGYYGPHGDESLTEDAPPGDDFLARLCVAWEAAAAPLDEMGVRRVILRTGVVLSTAGGAFPRLLLPFRLFAGGPMGSGRQWMSWIHVADEVAAIRFLLERPDAAGPFNLTAPEPLTNAQFSRLLGRVMRRPALLPVPAFAMRLALGEAATIVLDGQRVLPRRLQELGFTFRFPTAEAALHDLLGK